MYEAQAPHPPPPKKKIVLVINILKNCIEN